MTDNIAGLPETGETMRAAVYYGKGDIRIQNVPKPRPKPNEILVKVAFNGICGTDLHDMFIVTTKLTFTDIFLFAQWNDGANFIPKTGCPHPTSKQTLPVVIGHEFAGTIVEVGKHLQDQVKVGQKVCVEPTFGCKSCDLCTDGHRNVCSDMGFIGLSGPPGGLGQYTIAKVENFHLLPDDMPLDVGALVEPLAVAWHAAEFSKHKPGQSCLVVGAGPIGTLTIRVLKARGAGVVICAEPAKKRQELAKGSGADHIIDPTKEDVAIACKKLTNGKGVDIAFDAAGLANGSTLNAAIKATRPFGQITNIAIHAAPVPVDMHVFYGGERQLNGIIGSTPSDWGNVIRAISDGRIKTDNLITAKIKLENLVRDGFEELINNKEEHVKIMVQHE